VIDTREFANPSFVANPPRRCYYCKSELFSELREIAGQEGLAAVLDGTNYDDRGDVRPGRKAAKECGVKSPLLEARLTKPDLRALARKYGLPNWSKPAAACLASRIPYGTRLEKALLARVDEAERLLAELGFTQIRVRHHPQVMGTVPPFRSGKGDSPLDIARIEVLPEEFGRMVQPVTARRVVQGLQKLGYRYVTLDLAGYRTGSMNLPPATQSSEVKTRDRPGEVRSQKSEARRQNREDTGADCRMQSVKLHG
jgi:uncharacterized protein